MDSVFLEKKLNAVIFISVIIYAIIYLFIEIRKRQRVKKFKVAKGIIKEINKLSVSEFDEEEPYRYELVVCFFYHNDEHCIYQKVEEKLYKYRLGNEIDIYIDNKDILNSTINAPYSNIDIISIIIGALPFILLTILIAYFNS